MISVQDAAIARTCFSPVDDMASGSGEPNAAVAEDGKSKEDKPQASVHKYKRQTVIWPIQNGP
jgi:hypothetical protein